MLSDEVSVPTPLWGSADSNERPLEPSAPLVLWLPDRTRPSQFTAQVITPARPPMGFSRARG